MNQDHGFKREVIACDVGATNVRAATYSAFGLSPSLKSACLTGLSYGEIICRVEEIIGQVATTTKNFEAIGLSMAGHVDPVKGTVSHHTIGALAERYETHAICARLRSRFGVPVVVENDGNAACIAEWRGGAARDAENIVSLTVGTFIGSGIVLRGQLLHRRSSGPLLGAILFAKEATFEHAWWACGGHALGLEGSKTFGRDLTCAEVFRLALNGNADAAAIFTKAGRALGALIASSANIFEPEVVVLTGSVMKAASLLLPPAMEVINQFSLPTVNPCPKIVVGQHCENAGIVGAGIIALQHMPQKRVAANLSGSALNAAFCSHTEGLTYREGPTYLH